MILLSLGTNFINCVEVLSAQASIMIAGVSFLCSWVKKERKSLSYKRESFSPAIKKAYFDSSFRFREDKASLFLKIGTNS
jgi:hypothetical protein